MVLPGMVPTANPFRSKREHSVSSTMSLSHNIRCSVNLCECIVEGDEVTGSRQPGQPSPPHTGQTAEDLFQETEATAKVFGDSIANNTLMV